MADFEGHMQDSGVKFYFDSDKFGFIKSGNFFVGLAWIELNWIEMESSEDAIISIRACRRWEKQNW